MAADQLTDTGNNQKYHHECHKHENRLRIHHRAGYCLNNVNHTGTFCIRDRFDGIRKTVYKGPGEHAEDQRDCRHRTSHKPQHNRNRHRHVQSSRHRRKNNRQRILRNKAEVQKQHQQIQNNRECADSDIQSKAVRDNQNGTDKDDPVNRKDRADDRQNDDHEQIV